MMQKPVVVGGVDAQAHVSGDHEKGGCTGTCRRRWGTQSASTLTRALTAWTKSSTGIRGHAHPVGGVVAALGVAVGAEELNLALCGPVRLQALKKSPGHSGRRRWPDPC